MTGSGFQFNLPRPATGRILWSRKFDAARAETLDLQDDIARGIIVELEPALTQAEIAVICACDRRMSTLGVATTKPQARLEPTGGMSILSWRLRISCDGHSNSTATSPSRERNSLFCRRLLKAPAASSNFRRSILKRR